MELYQILIIAGVVVTALVVFLVISGKKNKWVSTEDFQTAKGKLKRDCSEEEFDAFFSFLKTYKGGYVRRSAGQIVEQGYLGKEKGDLKGIFFNVVYPNHNLSTGRKEEFRRYLVSVGVNGLDERPSYETRDNKLKNRATDEDEYQRKAVGNAGEQAVRNVLDQLDPEKYAVINGPVLKLEGVTREYDHIVVGVNGLFVIETKAFGMTDGKSARASLFIDAGDKWIIRKNGNNRDLESPTKQVMEEKRHLEQITESLVEVHPILVLSNTQLFVKQNISLSYDVIRQDALKDFIEGYNEILRENEKSLILQKIDRSRIN